MVTPRSEHLAVTLPKKELEEICSKNCHNCPGMSIEHILLLHTCKLSQISSFKFMVAGVYGAQKVSVLRPVAEVPLVQEGTVTIQSQEMEGSIVKGKPQLKTSLAMNYSAKV